jgi:hypothetical protein
MSPSYEFLSAPVWLITGLHVLTLALHFAAMGLLFGGLGLILVARVDDKWNRPAVRTFLRALPSAMAATVTLGVAPLLFVQLVYHRQVYAAAIVSAWYWMALLAAVVVAYFLLYRVALVPRLAPGRVSLWLTVAFVALFFVSLVYAGVFSMAEAPGTIQAAYAADASGRSFNPDLGAWLWRWFHMVAGAFTLGAFGLGVFARRDERFFAYARGALVVAMSAAVLAGLLYLGNLGPLLARFLQSPALLFIGLTLVLSLVALALFFRGRLAAAGALLFVSLLSMVANRQLLRSLRLEGVVDSAAMPFRPQWSVLVLFAVCFVLALAAVGVMLRLYFGERGKTIEEASKVG